MEHLVYPGTERRTILKCYLKEIWCED